jgi:hypothetical protein
MRYQTKAVATLLVFVASVALAACGSSGDSNGSTGGGTVGTEATAKGEGAESGATIAVKNGEPVGGVQRLEYSAGDQIRFTVDSDVADEVHVHGYDLMKDVPAGGSVSFSFPAEIEGIFEVELEGRKEQIAEIRVNP